MSNLFVLCLGIGTVFVGLICIIVLCKLMSIICTKFSKKPVRQLLFPPLHPLLRWWMPFPTGRRLLRLFLPPLLRKWARMSPKSAFFLYKKSNLKFRGEVIES